MAIKNIVFDVGDVLVDFCYKDYMRSLGFTEKMVEDFTNNIINSPHWNEMDKGVLTIPQASEIYKKENPQYEKELDMFCDNIMDIVKEYDYSYDLLKTIKDKGLGVYILSNYPEDLAKMHWPTFRFLKNADGYIISGDEKHIKPYPEIYRLLESRFGLNLTECIFVDDREVNIKGADDVGMKGILFRGLSELKKEFEKYEIYID